MKINPLDILDNKWLTVTICAYEVVAIMTGKVPTITRIHSKHPAVGITLTAAMAGHFFTARKASR